MYFLGDLLSRGAEGVPEDMERGTALMKLAQEALGLQKSSGNTDLHFAA